MKTYLEFTGEDSKRASGVASKFWEVTQEGSSLKIRFGRIGTSGQTTLKEFESEAAAEAERTKLVLEKIRKGYLDPRFLDDSESETEPDATGFDEKSEEVIAATKLLSDWSKKFKPECLVTFELAEMPATWSENKVWSIIHDYDNGEFLTNGFMPHNEDLRMPVVGYVLAKNSYTGGSDAVFIQTELQHLCEECDEDAEVDGEECPTCFGQGYVYYEVPIAYPLIINSSEELTALPLGKPDSSSPETSKKFCSECGTPRTPHGKFCGNCGSKF